MKNNGSVYLPELAEIVSARQLTDMEKYFELSFKDHNGFKFSPVMYKYVLLELQMKQVPEGQIIISLERRMKCGIGKCGHCQINGVYVCLDGPKFSYHTLKFLSEAI